MAATTIAQSDQDVQRDVRLELKWDARVSPNEIGVAVKDGVVTVSGTVDNYPRKWSAERAALRVRGVIRAVALCGEVDWGYERTEAERVVRNLVGVKGVTNLVTIRACTGPAPKELKNH